MFDEIEKKESEGEETIIPKEKEQSISEENPSKEVEDIFSSGDDDLGLGDSETIAPSYNLGKEKPAKNEEGKDEGEGDFSFLKLFIIIALIVIFSGSSYFAYTKYLKEIIFDKELIDDVDLTENIDIGNVLVDQEEKSLEDTILENMQVEKEDENMKNNVVSGKDTDGDGLSDKREMELGINMNSIDTDGDGLFDREEVEVYKTDPNNIDSDGDSFSDGDEVSAGYNPNGEGKLYDINIE